MPSRLLSIDLAKGGNSPFWLLDLLLILGAYLMLMAAVLALRPILVPVLVSKLK